jgi:hypothetical protein
VIGGQNWWLGKTVGAPVIVGVNKHAPLTDRVWDTYTATQACLSLLDIDPHGVGIRSRPLTTACALTFNVLCSPLG